MQTAINILYVNHVSAAGGGAETSMLELLDALDRDSVAPRVAAPPEGTLIDELRQRGIGTHPVPLRRLTKSLSPVKVLSALNSFRRVTPALSEIIRNHAIDILHANSTIAHLYASIPASTPRPPLVWHCRDMVHPGPLGRWMARRATRIVAISNTVRDSLKECMADAETLVTIPNGIDVQRFTPAARGANYRCAHGLDENAFVVGMVAHFAAWKNHCLFLQAASHIKRELPQARFLVIGKDLFGDSRVSKDTLVREANRLGIDRDTRFAGFEPDIRPAMEAMNVLVHPAAREPFGRVVAEAMALKTPVVAVDDAGPAEIIQHEDNGLLSAPTAETLAHHVLKVAQTAGLAQQLGESARQRIVDTFNVSRVARQFADLYRGILRR
ncbi:MAG: glycosyltransferase family 4 protein [Candidatus Pacebacteria bacterium]|nr:glycosyltransferase family 4 protein [Candidatus Paceibacterota bacterium]